MVDQPGMVEDRPLPARTESSGEFWDFLLAGELRIQRCLACQTLQYQPELTCGECGAAEFEWELMSGRATLYSWTIGHPPLLPYFANRAPWPVVAVELDEGPRLVSNIRSLDPADYRIGMRLRAAFEQVAPDVTLVVFDAVADDD